MSQSSLPDLGTRLYQEVLDGQIDSEEPGAVIAVYRDGTMIGSACKGVSDTETGELLSADTLMNIASVSKQITSTAVLIAAREGILDLDADIRGLIPEVKVSGVTLRHCLNHTAGLPDYLAVAYTVGIPEIEIAALAVFLEWIANVSALEFVPGDFQSYSNTGYVLAALALERATATPFPVALNELVFAPLGMSQTFSTTVLGEFLNGMAFSFTPNESGAFVKETMGVGEVEPVRGVNGDGEIITSLNEFGAWQSFLIDGRILGDDIRRQLLQRTVLNDGRETLYGFGIEHETKAGTTAFAHSGGMWGFSAYSIVDEKTGVSVACFSNRGGFDPSEAAWKAMHYTTGLGDITGNWFSTSTYTGITLELQGNGNLAVTTASRQPAETLVLVGERTWAGGGDYSRVVMDGVELEVTSWAGITERFTKLQPTAEFPPSLLGTFQDAAFGKDFMFEDREGKLLLTPPAREAESVRPFGILQDKWLGETSLGWVLFDANEGNAVQIGLATYSEVLVSSGLTAQRDTK